MSANAKTTAEWRQPPIRMSSSTGLVPRNVMASVAKSDDAAEKSTPLVTAGCSRQSAGRAQDSFQDEAVNFSGHVHFLGYLLIGDEFGESFILMQLCPNVLF